MDSQSSLRSDDKHAPICLAKVTRAPEGNRAAFPRPRRERGSGGCEKTARVDRDLT